MYPVIEDVAFNSQSDETRKLPVWYCSQCKDTFLMEEQEEIEATLCFISYCTIYPATVLR